MRRNAVCAVALSLIVFAGGCSFFGKKKTDASVGSDADDLYANSFDEGAYAGGAYDPYAAPTTPSERSYEPTTTTTTLTASTPSGGVRYHTVVKKDTLYGVARRYYNDQSRWKDIYEANRDKISDPDRIRVGQKLIIP